MSSKSEGKSESELAEFYDRTHDLSEFEDGEAFPVEVRRNVTISVRFSEEEIALLRGRAAAAGERVTAYIRSAALQQASPVDRRRLLQALKDASADVAKAERLLDA